MVVQCLTHTKQKIAVVEEQNEQTTNASNVFFYPFFSERNETKNETPAHEKLRIKDHYDGGWRGSGITLWIFWKGINV